MSGNYDLNNIMASIKQELLNSNFKGTLQLGDITLDY
jgi:hypothetical protein